MVITIMRNRLRNVGVVALVLLGAACATQADTDTIAGGKDASLAKTDAAKFREYTVPAGTTLSLTLVTALDSGKNKVEDAVNATLAHAVSVNGTEVLPAGSSVSGIVSAVKDSGKVKGLASMTVNFTRVSAAGRDDRYDIDASYSETANTSKGADAAKIGVGAGAGAIIGGALGGKSGAAKGGAIGAGAGTGVVLATKGKQVEHAAGAMLKVTLKNSVDVKVPIK